MPRSATQRAARRRQRQLRWLRPCPTFPLLSLPPELQMLVLCKCDPPAILHLLQISPYLEDLFYAYRETCLQEILHQIPRPVRDVLCLSWALHSIANDDFDTTRALALIERSNITRDWCTLYPRILRSEDDPIDTLEGLSLLHEEVSTIADIYAEAINAQMETFVNPFVEIQPFTLSPTEFGRIASSFGILRVFYQLQIKLRYHGRGDDFIGHFMHHLHPWQIEQVVAAEYFLQRAVQWGYPVPRLVPRSHAEYFAENFLKERSAYVRGYYDVSQTLGLYHGNVSMGQLQSFSRAARIDVLSTLPPWSAAPALLHLQREPPLSPLKDNDEDETSPYGWKYLVIVNQQRTVTDATYSRFFLDLGFFFWDKERLARWDLANPSEHVEKMATLRQRILSPHNY